ncbi:unnamed protein product [Bursaphelenchus okinawaensis]|uniref:G-protein coupled receptors family 1 profile domain-containing protein n=1 Tax=Bursaphelenchus okinawaensis TaxID=465554 RepID=A0A811KTX4_9BILA|nr:unnamed protein product [Bursaphelenchus okinawaensis]CAG9112304.1 unnamed protein product [Bursaphelenchus okinawaensis]
MDPDFCTYISPPLADMRIWLVTVFGSMISLTSILENIFFFFHFLRRKHHRTTYNIYMMMIAFFDVFVSLAYIFLMSVGVFAEYYEFPSVIKVYYYYMPPMLTVSHIAITTTSFLILAATIERFCITLNTSWSPIVQRRRQWIVFIAILMGVISKGGIFIEMKVVIFEECKGQMTEYGLAMEAFSQPNTPYNDYFRFYYRNFVTIFFPFFALFWLNILIVRALHNQEKYESVSNNNAQTKRKAQARAATRTMVLVVCTYLISNIPNVFITTWEHVDKGSLVAKEKFYAITIDMLSILTNMACAFRPIIYMLCQAPLRKEVAQSLRESYKRCISTRRRTTPQAVTTTKGQSCTLTLATKNRENNIESMTKPALPQALIANLDESSETTQSEVSSKFLNNMNNETLL